MNDKSYNSYNQTVSSNSPARKGAPSPKKDGSSTKPQPRFIRKKPQVIQSIEFCKELKTSYLDDQQPSTPSQAPMSPGKVRQASEDGTPPQLRTNLVFHPQKRQEDNHQEVYDYDEELMHAQVPMNQEDHEEYKTNGMDEDDSDTDPSPQPQLNPPPQHSVIQEVTEYSSLPPFDAGDRQQNNSGLTYTLNNTSSLMNITDQQQQTAQRPRDLDMIKVMMEDLRKKKQQELQQLMYVKPLFSVEHSDDQADSDEKSDKKQARRGKQERSNIRVEKEGGGPVSISGYHTMQSLKESPKRGGENLEALKQKKIEEIKNKLISERTSQGIQPYKQIKKVEEEHVKPSLVSHKYNSREHIEKVENSKEPSVHQMVTRPKTAHPTTKDVKRQKSIDDRKQALKTAIQQKAQQQTRNFQQFEASQFQTQTPVNSSKDLTRVGTNKDIHKAIDQKPKDVFKTLQTSTKPSFHPHQRSPRFTSPVPPTSTAQLAAHHTLASLAPHLMLSPSLQQVQDQYKHQHQLMSERTQQIVFKKLQKEMEGAIRNQDHAEKGSLNMEEFKRCLYSLDYLGYMQVEEEEQMQQQHLRRFFNGQSNPRYPVSTKKSMVMQEKEFVYNFWCIMNPMNQTEVDNALLYDILLLLIYNVHQPLHVTINYLTEYLENNYSEQGIDIESFANYNSGSSQGTGGSPDHPLPRHGELSNLSKYLSYCNLWPIERLTFEFRQIHASKLSQQFSSSNSKKRASVSPMAQDGINNQTLVNPTDGRRYKKAVIEDHLSNLTFSPKISIKTKALDQKVTQKLLTHSLQPQLRRDASADILAQNSSSHFTLNLEPIQTNPPVPLDSGMSPSLATNFKRYDLLLFKQQMTKEKIEKAKETKNQKQLEECTFHPKLSTENSMIQGSHTGTLKSSKSYQNLQKQTNTVFKDIAEKVKIQRSKLFEHTESSKAMASHTAAILKEEKELEECTFKPKINQPNGGGTDGAHRTPRRQENESIAANQVPRGYYQMVNRMRKVNEERKALEEKIHKKVIGENYDRVKLMNLKPPSFVQSQGEKKKKKLLMYIDVNITPTRTGRIGIYEGDDVRELAKNFKKTFQLNNNMLGLLTQQLEQHLQIYKERNGLMGVEGTTFPTERASENDQNGFNFPQGSNYNGPPQNIDEVNILTQDRPIEELKSENQFENAKINLNKIPDFVPQTSYKDERASVRGFTQIFDQNHAGKSAHYNQQSNPGFFIADEDSPSQRIYQDLQASFPQRGDLRYPQRNSLAIGSSRRTGESSLKHQEDSMGASSDRTRLAGVDNPGFFGIPINDINIKDLTQRNTAKNAGLIQRNDETFY